MLILPIQPPIAYFDWNGSQNLYLDKPTLTNCERVIVGCYGGHSEAGADKNEDGALVWVANDGSWEFAMLLDGHCSAQSVELVMDTIGADAPAIAILLEQPVKTMFRSLQQHLLSIFHSIYFRKECQQISGETACLICVRKAQFLGWFNIGDCVLYLLHPELARMKQFALNQRSFFEWVGKVNTFDSPVPCYSSGIRELRQGHNQIVMVTDGLLECGQRHFEDPQNIYDTFMQDLSGPQSTPQARALSALQHVEQECGRDSATLITWSYENIASATLPSQENIASATLHSQEK